MGGIVIIIIMINRRWIDVVLAMCGGVIIDVLAMCGGVIIDVLAMRGGVIIDLLAMCGGVIDYIIAYFLHNFDLLEPCF